MKRGKTDEEVERKARKYRERMALLHADIFSHWKAKQLIRIEAPRKKKYMAIVATVYSILFLIMAGFYIHRLESVIIW